LGDRAYGLGVLPKMRALADMERWGAAAVAEHKFRRLRRLLCHAWRNVPFYRTLWGDHGVSPDSVRSLEDLAALPRVDKPMLIAAGDAALDRTAPGKAMLAGASSGSTGEPFRYRVSREQYGWTVAENMLGWMWAGWQLGLAWIRVQFRGALSRRRKLEDWMLNCLYMPADRFDEEFVVGFLDRAARVGPAMIRGYAGILYLLARLLLRRGDNRLRPAGVVTTGDTLYPHYRQAIEEAFGCRVTDTYGGEGINVAAQCPHGLYHVMPTTVCEHLPEGPPHEDGQGGRLILTALENTAMPFIRYDIADLGILGASPCPCGRSWQTLRRILGRDVDIVVTPAGRFLVCHHFNNIIRKLNGVEQFQVVQSRPDSVAVRLVVGRGYDPGVDGRAIVEQLTDLGGEGFAVKLEYVREITVPPTGKRRYVISTVPTGAVPAAADRRGATS
jgi:phenylacetate-CoA ligase